MNDSEFILRTDRIFAFIGAALDGTDADVDWALDGGVLTIDCDEAGKMIVNRNAHHREIWIAARAGGSHYRLEDGRWRNTRSGEGMAEALSKLLREQAGIALPVLDLDAA